METSSPTEERGGAQVPQQVLNSMLHSLSADQSQSTAVESVGQSYLESTLHQQHGEQCDHKQMEVGSKELNPMMIQEGGKHLDVEGTEICVIQPSSTTVQEIPKQSHFKELKVSLIKLNSTTVRKYCRQSNGQEPEVCLKHSNSNTVKECGRQSNDISEKVLEPSNVDPLTKKALPQSLTNCSTSAEHTSCDLNKLSGTPYNTMLNAGETSALVSTTNYPIIKLIFTLIVKKFLALMKLEGSSSCS
jgi:hypothetical protein